MALKKMKKLSVVLPVYNERPFIRESVTRVKKAVEKLELEAEMILVDDGSTDGTKEELQQLQKEIETLRIFFLPVNGGKGVALRKGIAEASGEIILFQDADLEYDPGDIKNLLKPLLDGQADVVYGSRFTPVPARKILNFHHQVGNQLLTLCSNLATGLNLTDMETGYKAFRADVLKTIPLRSQRFGIEPEITAKIAKRHCTIFEVPISYNGRSYGEGKKITWRDGFRAIYTIFKYWLLDDCYYKEQIAETFLDIERTHHAQENLIMRLLPYFGDRLLELGSGFGGVSRILPVREKITLSEWRPEFLKLLQQGFIDKKNVEIEELDITAEKIPGCFKNRFDSVLLLNQLQLINLQDHALKNIHDLLQTRGRLLLTLPGPGDLGCYEKNLGYLRRYDFVSAKNLLERNGYRIIQHFSANFPALMIWKRLVKKNDQPHLPIVWAKISDTLVRRLSFFEKYFRLEGLTLVFIAEKISD